MSRTILSVAYPFAQVGPTSVGGAEQILTSLESGLVDHGHQSVVVACQGSLARGRLFETPLTQGIITPAARRAVTAAHQETLDRALQSCTIDLIHLHGIDFHSYRLPPGFPVLVTLHMPPSWYPDAIWSLPPNYHLQCVSETQRRACPPEHRARLHVVENGVSIPALDTCKLPRSYALMLSRICPEKNLHAGLDAARLAGVPALLAGETFPYAEHLRYLEEEIKPRLGTNAHLLGPVGGSEKARLLAGARCLLLPTLAPETSSLVAMEALAAGTPVIAFPSGAIPEIVEPNRTGFLPTDVAGMAAGIARVEEIDPAVCRAIAATRYSRQRMIDNYLALYDIVLGQGVESRRGPLPSDDLAAETQSVAR